MSAAGEPFDVAQPAYGLAQLDRALANGGEMFSLRQERCDAGISVSAAVTRTAHHGLRSPASRRYDALFSGEANRGRASAGPVAVPAVAPIGAAVGGVTVEEADGSTVDSNAWAASLNFLAISL